MTANVENERVFEHYLDFPPELRMMILDELQPADRCRFTRCSKLSQKEAKASKNYIHGLELMVHRENNAYIQINFGNYNENPEDSGCMINFEDHSGKKCMYQKHSNVSKRGYFWLEELDSSTNLVEMAVEHFKRLLNLYQNKIKVLSVHEWLGQTKLDAYDYGITSLNSIEEIRLGGNISFLPVFSVIRHPLKRLMVGSDGETIRTLRNSHEIYEVQDLLDIGRTTFTNEQFLRLSAPEVHIHIGDLTERDIYHFIQSWKNGTLGKKINSYSWRKTRESTFDKIKLFRLLGLGSDDDEERTLYEFEIKNFKESGVCAVLKYGNEEDVFDYEENDGDDDEEDDDEDVEEEMEENNGEDGQDEVEEEAGNEMEVSVDDWDKVLWFYVKNDED